jgi:hypothetical protein
MMRTVLLSIVLISAAGAAACGGTSKPATSTTTTEAAGNPGGGHHHTFPAEMGAFHDRLAPLGHADTGQARLDQTCTATGELDVLARMVQDAAPPAGFDAARWRERSAALSASVVKLSAACGDPTRATFEADFQAVHSAFHGLIELLPATEEEHKAAEGASELGVDPAGSSQDGEP